MEASATLRKIFITCHSINQGRKSYDIHNFKMPTTNQSYLFLLHFAKQRQLDKLFFLKLLKIPLQIFRTITKHTSP